MDSLLKRMMRLIKSGEIKDSIQNIHFKDKYLTQGPGAALLDQISDRQARGFAGYWSQFGYEIAGPACFAFVKWLADTLEEGYPDVTDIAFVARDGYLLKKIYELLPYKSKKTTHYIYAPRALCIHCQQLSEYEQYRDYLENENMGDGTIAVVDTVTMHFSAQRLVEASVDQPVCGFYWVVLREAMLDKRKVRFHAFQKEMYHVISSWNLMEFIMTSPEPPIYAIENGKPVYYEKNEFEEQRKVIFAEMSQGILEFVEDLIERFQELPPYPEEFVVGWINNFLKHPTQGDIEAFKEIKFSTLPDHSDAVFLTPFQTERGISVRILKENLWRFSQRHPDVFYLMHALKKTYKIILPKNTRKKK